MGTSRRRKSRPPHHPPTPPSDKAIQLAVPDHDDWTTFMAEALFDADASWRERHGDPAICPANPGRSQPRNPGRPSRFLRCYVAYRRGLDSAIQERRAALLPSTCVDCRKLGVKELWLDGRRLTQYGATKLMQQYDPGLSKEVCRKHARLFETLRTFLLLYRASPKVRLPEQNRLFISKYWPDLLGRLDCLK